MNPFENSVLLPKDRVPQIEDLSEFRRRFASAPWLSQVEKYPVTLVGCGGIGSWTAILLSRLGTSLTIVDDDVFEAHNVSGQLISPSEIGLKKVAAIQKLCHIFSNGCRVNAYATRFTHLSSLPKVFITGLDNMESRKALFESWLEKINALPMEQRADFMYIDGRLSADALQIYAFRGCDTESIQHYQQNALFAQSEADATVCSFKQTSHLACMIASKIVADYTGFLTSTLEDQGCYMVPYFEQYDAVLFTNIIMKEAPKN